MSSTFLQPRVSRADHNGGSLWAALFSPIRRPFAWMERELRIHRDVKLLMSFDDRALADIGLSRGEVLYAVRHGDLPERATLRR
jgi:uncharacterized protein YjiS (DUF1127 family)